VAVRKIGGIDDEAWRAPAPETAASLGGQLQLASIIAVISIAALLIALHGVNWVTAVLAGALGALSLFVIQRRLLGPLLAGLLILAVGMLAVEAINLAQYRSLSLDGPPSTIQVCGRSYVAGRTISPAMARGPRDGGVALDQVLRSAKVPLHEVASTPSGSAIFAGPGCGGPQPPVLVFSPLSAGGTVVFSLQGGP